MGWVTRISPYYYDLLLTLKGQRSRSSTWSSWKCWNTVVFYVCKSTEVGQSTLTTDQNILQQSPDCSILGLVCHAMQCRFSCTVFSFIVHTAEMHLPLCVHSVIANPLAGLHDYEYEVVVPVRVDRYGAVFKPSTLTRPSRSSAGTDRRTRRSPDVSTTVSPSDDDDDDDVSASGHGKCGLHNHTGS